MYCLEENTVVFEEHKPQTGRDTDHIWPKDALQNKASATWHSDESVDLILSGVSMSPDQDGKRPIRRVRSPSRPRARGSSSYKPKFEGHFYKQCYTKNEHPSYKPGSGSQRYHHSSSQAFLDRRRHFHPKPHHSILRDREREKEKKWQEWREIPDEISPQKKDNTTRPLPRSNSSRDKDMQFTVSAAALFSSHQKQRQKKNVEEYTKKSLSISQKLPNTMFPLKISKRYEAA
ncbi:hypothetical protein JOB18_025490 [Solea senegalensis]|uniref:Uncharacterized protein n=1 Tax=Solea senegalensis TaxID=28829 RepID=A0AAV6SRL2_SOLSE|nr:uncharacterized protein LOC122776750 [Solea senegalensis]KAG7520218.1 hypothetical protein JOB18_025490 [Solea senegalensis]